MDIASILSAVGQIVGGITSNINLDGKTYNDIRKQEGVPTKKDWFGQYKTDSTKQYYIIFIVLIFAAILSIAVLGFSKKKN